MIPLFRLGRAGRGDVPVAQAAFRAVDGAAATVTKSVRLRKSRGTFNPGWGG
jgi:hypothetical protein